MENISLNSSTKKTSLRIQNPTPFLFKDKLEISWGYTFYTFLAIFFKGTNQTGKQKPIISVSAYWKFLQEFEDMATSVLELTW